jgi:hypothetical protein
MEAAEADQSQFANFTQTTRQREKKLVDNPSYYSTICGRCVHVCHQQCGLEEIQERGSHKFTSCAAFGGDNCRICPSTCSYTEHFHDRKLVVEEYKTVDEIIDDIKNKYDLAVDKFGDAVAKQGGLAAARQAVDDGISKLVADVQAKCDKIKSVASNFNLAAELNISIKQLEDEKATLTNLDSIDTAQRFIDTIRNIVNALSKTTKAPKNQGMAWAADAAAGGGGPSGGRGAGRGGGPTTTRRWGRAWW